MELCVGHLMSTFKKAYSACVQGRGYTAQQYVGKRTSTYLEGLNSDESKIHTAARILSTVWGLVARKKSNSLVDDPENVQRLAQPDSYSEICIFRRVGRYSSPADSGRGKNPSRRPQRGRDHQRGPTRPSFSPENG